MKFKTVIAIIFMIGSMLAAVNGGKAAPIRLDRIVQVAQLSGGGFNDAFGYSTALSGDTLAVGDPYDSEYGEETGSVTVYQSDPDGNWQSVARISPADPRPGDIFGRNIALSGDLLVVGAPTDLSFGLQTGSAYIYERNQGGDNAWGQIAKLTASDAQIYNQFGWAVAVEGNTVIVGAYTNPNGGRVYIFERDAGGPGNWGETAQLDPDPPGLQACFGESVDLDGDILAIGAYGGGDYAGYVYVFQRQTGTTQWQRLTKFRGADTGAYHYFGYAVALDQWKILAGAPGADGLMGAAYIFVADAAHPEEWAQQARLTASDAALQSYFGLELDLAGEHALVGAPMHESRSGAAYVFTNEAGEWKEAGAISGDDTIAGDEFGYSISIDGDLAVTGAPGHPPQGSLYIFGLNQPWKISLPLIYR